jgi:hypothetical protein
MARQAEMTEHYEFFYHAACSYVHASLHHALRMVWGDPDSGVFSITNRNFGQFYGRFALTYGSWLMAEAVALAEGSFDASFPEELTDAYDIWFAIIVKPSVVRRAPAIVTRDELRWTASSPKKP